MCNFEKIEVKLSYVVLFFFFYMQCVIYFVKNVNRCLQCFQNVVIDNVWYCEFVEILEWFFLEILYLLIEIIDVVLEDVNLIILVFMLGGDSIVFEY